MPTMDWNIYGHEWAVKMLKQHISRDSVRHAYLFSGPPGIGRKKLALRFAQALNCSNPPEKGVPCRDCRICRQTELMQQTDLSVIEAENEGGTLKVEQIRNLQHTLSLSPYESHYRIAILHRFEEANSNAQNALLKTLEEAPQKVILLLTADSVENLLPTIVSRCEILRLRPMKLNDLSQVLQTKFNLGAEEARKLSHFSGGKIEVALRMHNDPAYLEERREQIEELVFLLKSNRRERFNFADRFRQQDSKEKVRQILQTWLLFWRDILLTCAGSDVPLVNLDWTEAIHNYAEVYDFETARKCVADLENALFKIDTTNTNQRLLMEVLMLDWPLP